MKEEEEREGKACDDILQDWGGGLEGVNCYGIHSLYNLILEA